MKEGASVVLAASSQESADVAVDKLKEKYPNAIAVSYTHLDVYKRQVTGLRWCDIDLEDGIIDVNHTLVYYDHRTSEGKKGCYFNVNTPKTCLLYTSQFWVGK